MKRIVRKILRGLGYDIIRYNLNISDSSKSIRTNRLSFYETKTGKYFLPSDAQKDYVANAIRNDQIFDKEIVDLAAKYIKKDTVVLDLGANYGQMSILFSNMAGGIKVFSFDADDFIFEILKKNIEANNKNDSITPVFGALHDKAGEVLLFPEQDFKRFSSYGSYGIDYNAKEGRKVPAITIDSLNIIGPISFMKIDIQGGDLLAMKGAVKTIERNKMPILFEYEYLFEDEFNLNFQEYVDFINSINYKFVKVINGQNYLVLPK